MVTYLYYLFAWYVMNIFYSKLLLYIYIYIYKIAINLKRYTSIDHYQNILFHWPNWYSLQYEIDSLSMNYTLL